MITHPAKLAAIYCRVSTTDQKGSGYSLPTQVAACQQLAAQEGYTVPETHIFQDDYTGTSLRRPQLTQLRDVVQSRTLHALIVYDLDRLSRKLAHQLLLTEELEQYGVALHIVTMPATDTSPENQLLNNVKGIIAEYERAKILERTARGLRGRAQAGKAPGGAVPLGYRVLRHADGEVCEIVPEEAELIQRIFQWYVADGLSINAIAKRLTQARIPTQRDRRGTGPQRTTRAGIWYAASVHDILRNEAYIGTRYYGKTSRMPSRHDPDKKTCWKWLPRAEWIPIPVPPIIDEALFQAAQQQRQRNAQHSRRNAKHDYLLRQRVRCGTCGGGMFGQCDVRTGRLSYRCTRPRYQMETPCRGVAGAAALEATVWQAVEKVLRNPALIAAELERLRNGAGQHQEGIAAERAVYEKQLAQCDKDIARWEQAYLAEAIDVQDFKAKKAEILTRRQCLEQELAHLDAQERQIAQHVADTASLEAYCQRVRTRLHQFTSQEKRLALEALNITVVWTQSKPLEIHGSIPVGLHPGQPSPL